jgi:hypothetical protein
METDGQRPAGEGHAEIEIAETIDASRAVLPHRSVRYAWPFAGAPRRCTEGIAVAPYANTPSDEKRMMNI